MPSGERWLPSPPQRGRTREGVEAAGKSPKEPADAPVTRLEEPEMAKKKERYAVISLVEPCTLNKPTCEHIDVCKLRRAGVQAEHPLQRNFEPEVSTRIDHRGGLVVLSVWCGSFKEG